METPCAPPADTLLSAVFGAYHGIMRGARASILVALSLIGAGCGRTGLDLGPAPAGLDAAPDTATIAPDSCATSMDASWALSLPLLHGDCAQRPDQPCDPRATTNMGRAAAAVLPAIMSRCGRPLEVIFRVDLADGCASEIEIDGSAALAGCIASALGSLRWSCLGSSTCALYAEDTL
jgi:hypothetical protein